MHERWNAKGICKINKYIKMNNNEKRHTFTHTDYHTTWNTNTHKQQERKKNNIKQILIILSKITAMLKKK